MELLCRAAAYMRDEELRLGGGPALATLQPQQNAGIYPDYMPAC